jgi:hypothetical protein
MNCQDFERAWNEQLDAREAASVEVEQALEAHAAACPACQEVARRYQVLRQAIRVWGPPPAAPIGFADRFFERSETTVLRPARWVFWRRLRPAAGTAAVAAALLLAVVAGGRLHPVRVPVPLGRGSAPERTIDPQALTTALADATSATWDLARATSAPAARIGREVLAETRLPTGAALPLPGVDQVEGAGDSDSDPASDVLQRVSDGVNAGVVPLSGTARHAFGFLLGPAPAGNTPPPSNKGA